MSSYNIEFYESGDSNLAGYSNLGGAIRIGPTTDFYLQFTPVSTLERENGFVDYMCIYIKQTDYSSSPTQHVPVNYLNIKVDISEQPALDLGSQKEWIDIGYGTSGINGVEQVISDRFTAPTGVTFTDNENANPTLAGQIDLLTSDDHYPIWLKRTSKDTRGYDSSILFKIGFDFEVDNITV